MNKYEKDLQKAGKQKHSSRKKKVQLFNRDD